MNLLIIVLCILAFFVALPFGKKVFARKQQLVEEREAAIQLAVSLRANGLEKIPAVLEKFAVGSIVDLFTGLKKLAVLAKSGNKAIEDELEQTFQKVLDAKLKQPEGLALIKAKVASAEKK